MSNKISIETCEPFRAWNRLEPRPRKEDFEVSLQAGVHDALWFLTRQWQFGEFQGEDTGSAIFAKIHLQTTQLTHYRGFGANAVEAYSDATPLEETVERTHAPLNDKIRIQSGKYFLKILASYGVSAADMALYRTRLRELYEYRAIAEIEQADSVETKFAKGQLLSNPSLVQFNDFFLENDYDGYLLFLAADNDQTATRDAIIRPGTPKEWVDKSLDEYRSLFKELYAEELKQAKGAWNPTQLEYQFKCMMPEENNTKTILAADEYYSGSLDWYGLDIDQRAASATEFASATPNAALLKDRVMTVIPTEARFAGMPNSRWWQFEDGAVNLGNFKADTTDLASLIFSEYAFMYSNDWMIVPIPMPVGTLAEIKGIVVKDVFGEREFVSSAMQGQAGDWTAWGMYNLSVRQDAGTPPAASDTRLFIPPSVSKTHESKPVEQVNFVRDEMANMVWGVETSFDGGLGKGIDGHIATNGFKNYMEKIIPTPEFQLAEGAAMGYMLGNSVPENWIPFIPVHLGVGENRAIQFQRAAMPRTVNNINRPIRPTTTLLRHGINGNDKALPYYIHEEEIPRAGARVFSNYQRTRWYNGKVVNWFGNRKTMGRGEGASGLQFDVLRHASKL